MFINKLDEAGKVIRNKARLVAKCPSHGFGDDNPKVAQIQGPMTRGRTK